MPSANNVVRTGELLLEDSSRRISPGGFFLEDPSERFLLEGSSWRVSPAGFLLEDFSWRSPHERILHDIIKQILYLTP